MQCQKQLEFKALERPASTQKKCDTSFMSIVKWINQTPNSLLIEKCLITSLYVKSYWYIYTQPWFYYLHSNI